MLSIGELKYQFFKSKKKAEAALRSLSFEPSERLNGWTNPHHNEMLFPVIAMVGARKRVRQWVIQSKPLAHTEQSLHGQKPA